jgi:SAM-dependent methyltransferase
MGKSFSIDKQKCICLNPNVTKLMSFAQAARNLVTQFRRDGLRAALRNAAYRATVRWYEWRLGVSTEAELTLDELGLSNEEFRHYAPASYWSIRTVLDALKVDPDDVFLDFGSGMGRFIIMAARRPFRRVIGVEISEELNAIARRNVDCARGRLKCRVDVITADATAFRVPSDVTIVSFYNPFAGDVLRTVMNNLRQSLREAPRNLRVVCLIPTQSAFAMEIREQIWLKPERLIEFSPDFRCVIFSAI